MRYNASTGAKQEILQVSRTGNGNERRRWRRFFLRVEEDSSLCIVVGDGVSYRGRVMDISIGGARIIMEAGQVFQPETEISFRDCRVKQWGRFLNGARGFVKWVRGSEIGCQFCSPLGVSDE